MSKDSYRFDSRSKESFQRDIQRSTAIQRFLVSEWSAELAYRGINVDIIPYADGEDGRLLDKVSSEADYLISRIDQPSSHVPLEIKTNPKGLGSKGFCTYKTSDLRSVVKQDAYILLICGIDTKTNDPSTIDLSVATWALITPDKVQEMLLYLEPKKFGFQVMGNKECVRVYQPEYHLFWQEEKFFLFQ